MAQAATTTRQFTRADLAHLPDDGNRYELLDGMLLVTPAPGSRHQHVVAQVYELFRNAGAYVLVAPLDVPFSDDTVLQPDICVWRERFDLDGPTPVPTLVVEVSSPYTWRRDRSLKRDRYAAEGIAEYWFVDLRERQVLVHHLPDGATEYEVDQHTADQSAGSHLLDATTTFIALHD